MGSFPWSGVLLEKIMGSQLGKKFPEFMEPESSNRIQKILPFARALSRNNPAHALSSHLFNIYFNIILHLPLGLPRRIFSSGFPSKILYTFLFMPYVSYAPPTSSSVIRQQRFSFRCCKAAATLHRRSAASLCQG